MALEGLNDVLKVSLRGGVEWVRLERRHFIYNIELINKADNLKTVCKRKAKKKNSLKVKNWLETEIEIFCN